MPGIPGLPPFESGTKRAHAPALGEHTREVLAEHGYSGAEIEALYEESYRQEAGRDRSGRLERSDQRARASA